MAARLVREGCLVITMLVVVSSAALGQECFKVDANAAKVIALAGGSDCKLACAGCGCKGGPGYRMAPREGETRGQCVSYKQLYSACGPPPHSKCQRECLPVVQGCIRPDKASALARLDAVKKAIEAMRNAAGPEATQASTPALPLPR